jgi:CBS domain containing-hemolysin-like protein
MGDSMEIFLKLLAVFFFVLLNGFFVAAEFALVKIRETQLDTLVVKGHRRAKIARRVVNNLNAALSSTQLGITLASLGLGWIGEPVFAALLEPVLTAMQIQSEKVRHTISVIVGFSAISFLHIVVGEVAPKSLAIQKPLPTSLWLAQPLEWFYRISYPAIWVLNHAADWILRRFGLENVSESEVMHSREELRLLITASQRHSGGSALGRDIVINALDLSRRVARDVMRPRTEISFLDTDATLAECMEVADKTRFSRLPLCAHGDIDKAVGVVHIKDLYALRNRQGHGRDLLQSARKIIYIPENSRLEKLLQLFLERKLHLALVVDEFGGTVGLVTLENILEELVGQIQDEFDQEKPLIWKTGDHQWELDGALPLHELASVTGEDIVVEGVSTTSGWVTHRLGGFVKQGDAVEVGSEYLLKILEMDGLRVARLELEQKSRPVVVEEKDPKE